METARHVLGLGHPRGGTRYVSRLLVAAGIRALHEAKGRHGSVSCWLSVPDWYHPHASGSGLRSDYPADSHLLHIVRHPLTAIASLRVFHHGSWWHWQQQHTGVIYDRESLTFYAKFWIRWNELIEAQNPFTRILIEHPERAWPQIAATLGVTQEMPQVAVDPTWVTKKKPTVTWDDLGDMEKPTREMAEHLGYED